MNLHNCLIIFARNPIPGKVKTRLAATIGAERTLDIYKQLLLLTHAATTGINCSKVVYYSDHIEANDLWNAGYKKALQQGNNLGERMSNAFDEVLKGKFSKAVIIGTDCPELSSTIIEEAFDKLEEYDVVLGPAADGGYYLLGMKVAHPQMFSNIKWSTNTVLSQTIAVCNEFNLSYHCLAVLHDIDEESDLQYLNLQRHE